MFSSDWLIISTNACIHSSRPFLVYTNISFWQKLLESDAIHTHTQERKCTSINRGVVKIMFIKKFDYIKVCYWNCWHIFEEWKHAFSFFHFLEWMFFLNGFIKTSFRSWFFSNILQDIENAVFILSFPLNFPAIHRFIYISGFSCFPKINYTISNIYVHHHY